MSYRQARIYTIARRLLLGGLGVHRNKLIIKSFFRRRPSLLAMKLRVVLKYITGILLENINYALYIFRIRYSTFFESSDSLSSAVWYRSCSRKTYTSLCILPIYFFLHHYYVPRVYGTQMLSVYKRSCVVQLTRFTRAVRYFLELALSYITLYTLRLLRVALYKHLFSRQLGFAYIPVRCSKYTFLRSPHTDKRSRTQFAKKVYKAVAPCPFYVSYELNTLLKRFVGSESHASVELLSDTQY